MFAKQFQAEGVWKPRVSVDCTLNAILFCSYQFKRQVGRTSYDELHTLQYKSSEGRSRVVEII